MRRLIHSCNARNGPLEKSFKTVQTARTSDVQLGTWEVEYRSEVHTLLTCPVGSLPVLDQHSVCLADHKIYLIALGVADCLAQQLKR